MFMWGNTVRCLHVIRYYILTYWSPKVLGLVRLTDRVRSKAAAGFGRERKVLTMERVLHVNRIKGLRIQV
jgi:hypothetical protein